MPAHRHRLIAWSRDRDLLLRAVLAIVFGGVALGYALSHFGPAEGRVESEIVKMMKYSYIADFDEIRNMSPQQMQEYLEKWKETIEEDFGIDFDAPRQGPELEDLPPPPTPEEIAEGLQHGGGVPAGRLEDLPAELRPLFQSYGSAMREAADGEARRAVRLAAESEPPLEFARGFYGHLLHRAGEHAEAAPLLRAEIEARPDSTDFYRLLELASLLEAGERETLAARYDDPRYRALLDGELKPRVQIAIGRWWDIVKDTASNEFTQRSPAWNAVTLFAAGVWFLVLAMLGGAGAKPKSRLALYGAGFLLGMLSVFLVMPVIHFQRHAVGLDLNGEPLNDLVFFVSGVGLREEGLKWLCFLPLLPVLLKRRSAMEALAAAGCVGLGFAAVENLGYTPPGGEASLFSRFLTANFLHVSWTGLLGLATFHLLRWPRTRWEEFVATLLGVVISHGLYDYFIFHSFGLMGIPSILIMAMVVYRYLDKAAEIYEGSFPSVSPLGVFVVGGALIVAFAWMHANWHLALGDVGLLVGQSVLGSAIFVFLFIHRFRAVW